MTASFPKISVITKKDEEIIDIYMSGNVSMKIVCKIFNITPGRLRYLVDLRKDGLA